MLTRVRRLVVLRASVFGRWLMTDSPEPVDAKLELDVVALYKTHADRAHRIAYRVLWDHDSAAEAVQEAFLSLWLSRHAYRPEQGGVDSWLYTVVHHRAVDLARKRAHQRQTKTFDDSVLLTLAAAQRSPEDQAVDADLNARIVAAIRALPEAKRRALVLTCLHGRSHVETAEQLGIPLGTAKSRIRQAKADLRAVLREEGISR